MIKLQGPALSEEAAGKLANVLSFAKSKKGTYAKQLTAPAQPRTGGQVAVRAVMKFLAQEWKGIISTRQDTWTARAKDMKLYPYHAYISGNQIRWRSFLGLTQEDPPRTTGTNPDAPLLYADPLIAQCRIRTQAVLSGGVWGYFLFRSTTGGFTPAVDNCVAVFAKQAYVTTYFDTPLDPGTYYYRAQGFRWYGKKSPFTLEKSVTIVA